MKFLPLYNTQFILLYDSFAKSVDVQGFSRGKNNEIPNHLKEFMFFVENKGIADIKSVKASDIINYFDYLRQRPNQRRGGGLSDSSIRKHLYTLRLFFDHLLNTGHIESSPARMPKFLIGGNKEMPVLTVEEIQLLYTACRNRLERALLSLTYGAGLRKTEVELLDVGDILFSKGMINIRKGKGNKPRTVPVTDKIIRYLREYLIYERDKSLRPNAPCSSFLLNKYGRRLLGQQLSYHLELIVERAGSASIKSKNVSLHTMRRSIATHLMDNGADIDFVRRFLGHELLDTTHIYAKRRKQRVNLNEVFRRHTEEPKPKAI